MSDLESIVQRQMAFWDIRRRLADTGAVAVRDFPQLEEGPWLSVSRQLGSGGKELAARLSGELGWQAYDREILDAIGRDTEVRTEILSRLDEHAVGAFNDYVVQLMHSANPGQATYLESMTRVVWGLARQGNAIILGRGANWFLKPEFGLRLRVTASTERRAAAVARHDGLSIGDAERRVTEHDDEQEAFVRQVYHRSIDDPRGYDLILNLDGLDVEAAAEAVLAVLHAKLHRH
jgi:cytidylate kinase